MAIELSTDISGVLATEFASDVTKAFNRSAKLASLFPVKLGRGTALNWTVQLASSTASSWVAQGSAVDAAELATDTYKKMTLDWAINRAGFGISDFERSVAMSSGNSAAELLDIFSSHLANTASKMASDINQACFTGTGTSGSNGSIVGLDSIIKTSGSYAGLDYGTYTSLKSNVVAAGGALTLVHLNKLDGYNKARTADPFDVLVMSPSTEQLSKGLFAQTVAASVPGVVGNVSTVTFNGVPVVVDKDCADGVIYGLHLSDFSLEFLPYDGAVQSVSAPGVAPALPFAVKKLGATGNYESLYVECQVQLKCKDPRRQGKITGITGY